MQSTSQTSDTLPPKWNSRRELRTSNGAGVAATITLEADCSYLITVLMVDGSLNGCGVVAVTDAPVEVDIHCQLIVAGYGPIPARIAWVREIDRGVLRFGLQYLEGA